MPSADHRRRLPHLVVSGRLLWEFGAVIDRPAPLDVGMVDDSVVIIAGPDDATAPTIADVREADEEQWRRLLIEQPEPAGSSPADR